MFFVLYEGAAERKQILRNAALATLNHRGGKSNMHGVGAGQGVETASAIKPVNSGFSRSN
jgi:hypothetical protein